MSERERLAEMKLEALLEAIAAREPAPGGGAVAAIAGSLASALGQMAAAFSLGKKSLANEAGAIEEIAARLQRAQGVLLELADDDAEAFAQLAALEKLPEGDARRRDGLAPAAVRAATVPLTIIATSGAVLSAAEDLAPRCSRWLLSDLAICAILAEAAARSASHMVDANLGVLEKHAGASAAGDISSERDALLASLPERLDRVLAACRS